MICHGPQWQRIQPSKLFCLAWQSIGGNIPFEEKCIAGVREQLLQAELLLKTAHSLAFEIFLHLHAQNVTGSTSVNQSFRKNDTNNPWRHVNSLCFDFLSLIENTNSIFFSVVTVCIGFFWLVLVLPSLSAMTLGSKMIQFSTIPKVLTLRLTLTQNNPCDVLFPQLRHYMLKKRLAAPAQSPDF